MSSHVNTLKYAASPASTPKTPFTSPVGYSILANPADFFNGTHTGNFMGVPATGKQIAIEAIDILRLVDSKVVEHWGVMDTFGLMQQLGVIPAPGQAS